MRRFRRFGFIVAIAKPLYEAGIGDRRSCLLLAKDVLDEFLEDEEVKFNDPRFAWDVAGARDLARAYVLDHSEPRP
jgi:hypothetical protein